MSRLVQPTHRLMEPTSELRRVLSRRLKAVEGAEARGIWHANNAAGQESSDAAHLRRGRVQVPPWTTAQVPPAAATGTMSCVQEGSSDPHDGRQGPWHCQRRKVRVPSWIHDLDSNPCKFLPRVPGTPPLGSAFPSSAAMSQSACTAELLRKLRMTELERDAVRREALDTEENAAAQTAELEAEAQRLRSLAESLRGQLQQAQQEARGYLDHPAAQSASSTGHTGLAEVGAELRHLTAELYELDNERSSLKVKFDSLSAEVDRQRAERSKLEEQLAASEVQEDLLQLRLQALQEREYGPAAQQAYPPASVHNLSAKPRSPPWEEPRGDASPQAGAGAAVFSMMEDASTDAMDTSFHDSAYATSNGDAPGVHDLEFAYDWGLGLSGRMSVERALQLARWAAGAAADGTGSTTASETTPLANESDDRFVAPLAELQDALAVLQSASLERGPASRGANSGTAFSTSIADLQEVLKSMGGADAPSESSVSVGHRVASAAEVKDASEVIEPSAFDAPIHDLQKASAAMQVNLVAFGS